MKKLFVITVLCVVTCTEILAQQQPVLKSRRGINILPEAGNYALGIDANPFLNYLGNLFNNSTNNPSPGVGFTNGNGTIYGKYYKTATYAYRAQLRLGVMSQKNVFYSPKKPAINPGELAENNAKMTSTTVGIGFGIEKRKGNTRIQGYYGIEGLLWYNSGSDTKYTYGNKLQDEDTNTVRNTVINNGSTFSLNIRGFIGVEYFVAPKLSIGGEFGWGPTLFINSNSTVTSERWDYVNSAPIATKTKSNDKLSGLSIDNDNASGRIKLLFHF